MDSDLFISYARADSDRVATLVELLRDGGATVWVDTTDIPPGSQWMHEINQAIGRCSAVVCLLSPQYLASDICRHELDFAHECCKRTLPVLIQPITGLEKTLPDWLRSINWLDATVSTTANVAADIVRMARFDLEWTREHARLLVRAKEWDERDRPRSRLLKGRDIADAEVRLTKSRPLDHPQPTELQREFVAASRRARGRFVATIGTIAVLVSVGSLVLSVIAIRQRSVAVEQREVARAAESRAEQSLNRSNFERFSAAASEESTVRGASTAALASWAAVQAAGMAEEVGVVPLLTVLARADRPITTFVGRSEDQQYSGDGQGMDVSGDGSTLAHLTLTGDLAVVDLWDLTARSTIPDIGQPNVFSEQVALDHSGDTLLHVGVEMQSDENNSDTTYVATLTIYDISGIDAVAVDNGVVYLESGVIGVSFGPTADTFVLVENEGVVVTVENIDGEWLTARMGEPVDRAAADFVMASFSLDHNRVCLGGSINTFYQVQPPLLISDTVNSAQCFPEPCGGDNANRIIDTGTPTGELGTGGQTMSCVDPEGLVVAEIGDCERCAMVRGLPDEELILDAAVPTSGPRLYAVPGALGDQIVVADEFGRIDVWRAEPSATLPTAGELEFPEGVGRVPSGQPIDGPAVVVLSDGELLELGGTGPSVPNATISGPLAESVLDWARPVHVFGDDSIAVANSETGELVVASRSGDESRAFTVGEFNAADFSGELLAVASDDRIEVWNLRAGRSALTVPVDDWSPCAVSLSASGTALAATSCDVPGERSSFAIWEIDRGRATRSDGADLAFRGVSAVSVSDDADTASVAFGIGQVLVRHGGSWVQPLELVTEPYPTNDYHEGWAEVDTSGSWLVTRRHLEGIALWSLDGSEVSRVAQLLPEWDPLDPPIDAQFTADQLTLTWQPSNEFPAGRRMTWSLSPDWALPQVCRLLTGAGGGSGGSAESLCEPSPELPERAEPAAQPPPVTVDLDEAPGAFTLSSMESFALRQGSRPRAITVDDDGNVWIGAADVIRLDPSGAAVSVPVPVSDPVSTVIPRPEGGVFFASFFTLGWVSPDSSVHLYSGDPNSPDGVLNTGPAAYADGRLWVFELGIEPAVVAIDGAGSASRYPLPSEYSSASIRAVVGEEGDAVAFLATFHADGAVRSVLGDVKPDGSIDLVDIAAHNMSHMAIDADGGLWLVDVDTMELIRIDVGGDRLVVPLSQLGRPTAISTDAVGNLWFTTDHVVGMATEEGALSYWPVEGAESLSGIALDQANGLVWLVDSTASVAFKLTFETI